MEVVTLMESFKATPGQWAPHKVLIKLVFIFSVSVRILFWEGPPGPSSRLSPSNPLVSRRRTSSQERGRGRGRAGAPCKILFSGSNTARSGCPSLVFVAGVV